MKTPEHEASCPAYRAWCRKTFQMLANGGVWGVPRSGLVFRKSEAGDSLELIAPAKLDESQQWDFDAIQLQFREAGITVSRT